MRFLIIGSTGMLGQAIIHEAKARHLDAIGLARNSINLFVDLRDEVSILKAIREVRPEIIINAAAIIDLALCERDPALAYLVNARGPGLLAEIARNQNLYLIQISTDHYYTGDGSSHHNEEAHVQLLNEYARTKFAGEQFVLTCPGSLIIRTNIVGFRGKLGIPTLVEWALGALERQEPITLFDDFYTSSIDVGAFATALFDLVKNRPSGLLNLASREVASKKDFIEALAKRFGHSLVNTRTGSVKQLSGVPRAESLGLDVSHAEKLLGYRLPILSEVIDNLAQASQERVHEI